MSPRYSGSWPDPPGPGVPASGSSSGSAPDVNDPEFKKTLVPNGDGTYTKRFTSNIAGGTIVFKVVVNGDWDEGSYPSSGNQTQVIYSNSTWVQFDFNSSTGAITVTQDGSSGTATGWLYSGTAPASRTVLDPTNGMDALSNHSSHNAFRFMHGTNDRELTTALTGIVIVFSFFRIHQDLFKKDRFVGRCLQYVGRRTLDIYLLHYLLLPVNLKMYFTSLAEHPIPIIELTITLIIMLIIVAGCLVISRILRMSPTLAYLLFGVRKR